MPDFVDPDQQIELLELHLVVVAALSQDHDRADGVADLREAHYAVLLKCELIFEVVSQPHAIPLHDVAIHESEGVTIA